MCSGTRRAAARDAARDVQTKSTRQCWRKKLLCRPSQKPSSKQRVDLAKNAACAALRAARVAACDVGVNPTPPAGGMNPTPPVGGIQYSTHSQSMNLYEYSTCTQLHTFRWLLGARDSQSVSQLFHGPTPRSPLRRSRSNTSTEYTRSRGLTDTQNSIVASEVKWSISLPGPSGHRVFPVAYCPVLLGRDCVRQSGGVVGVGGEG